MITSFQGVRILMSDGSRAVMRLSGTGSSGATVRMYIESYESDPSTYTKDAQVRLHDISPLVDVNGENWCNIFIYGKFSAAPTCKLVEQ